MNYSFTGFRLPSSLRRPGFSLTTLHSARTVHTPMHSAPRLLFFIVTRSFCLWRCIDHVSTNLSDFEPSSSSLSLNGFFSFSPARTSQQSHSNHFVGCSAQFGEYHCLICTLCLSKEDHPFHCKDCCMCHVGGTKHFRHCHDCSRCIGCSLYNGHDCSSQKKKNALQNTVNCPVCQEDLLHHPVRLASHEMLCGHAIHWD